jgi:hypothetical protein
MDNMIPLNEKTNLDLRISLSRSFLRSRLPDSRKKASLRTGVSESSIKRFETSHEISLNSFVSLVKIYGLPDNFAELLPEKEAPETLAELRKKTKPARQRGRS